MVAMVAMVVAFRRYILFFLDSSYMDGVLMSTNFQSINWVGANGQACFQSAVCKHNSGRVLTYTHCFQDFVKIDFKNHMISYPRKQLIK